MAGKAFPGGFAEFKHGAGSFMKQMSPRQVVKWHLARWLVKAEATFKGQTLFISQRHI